jgi:hypothetical protein
MYVGNSIVFEPEFVRSFKPNESKLNRGYKHENWNVSRSVNRLSSTLYTQGDETRTVKRVNTAKRKTRINS